MIVEVCMVVRDSSRHPDGTIVHIAPLGETGWGRKDLLHHAIAAVDIPQRYIDDFEPLKYVIDIDQVFTSKEKADWKDRQKRVDPKRRGAPPDVPEARLRINPEWQKVKDSDPGLGRDDGIPGRLGRR